MLVVTVKYTREDGSIPFWSNTAKYVRDKKAQLIASGDLIVESVDVHPDNLTIVYTAIWASREAWEKYRADPVVAALGRMRAKYDAQNRIKAEMRLEEEGKEDTFERNWPFPGDPT